MRDRRWVHVPLERNEVKEMKLCAFLGSLTDILVLNILLLSISVCSLPFCFVRQTVHLCFSASRIFYTRVRRCFLPPRFVCPPRRLCFGSALPLRRHRSPSSSRHRCLRRARVLRRAPHRRSRGGRNPPKRRGRRVRPKSPFRSRLASRMRPNLRKQQRCRRRLLPLRLTLLLRLSLRLQHRRRSAAQQAVR